MGWSPERWLQSACIPISFAIKRLASTFLEAISLVIILKRPFVVVVVKGLILLLIISMILSLDSILSLVAAGLPL